MRPISAFWLMGTQLWEVQEWHDTTVAYILPHYLGSTCMLTCRKPQTEKTATAVWN
jgi:hypothetical protein